MHQDQLKEILRRYLAGKATPQETNALFDWYQSFDDAEVEITVDEQESRDSLEAKLYNRLQASIHPARQAPAVHRVHFLKTAWFRYAAILLILVGATVFYIISNSNTIALPDNNVAINKKADFAPGSNKAQLTLADGTVIILDSAAEGQLAIQGNTSVTKTKDGSLAYNQGNGENSIIYNTMSTPKGGQYHVILPDGSNVWLNAASSIRFPTSFSKERHVIITGEVYFEIAKKSSMPFRVSTSQGTEIQVLGTSFNVMSYTNEATVNTTLVEGAVKIIQGNQNILLKPGDQARAAKTITVQKNADIQKAIAWKNGIINIDGVGLREMMRQLERWYDIEVSYEGEVPDVTFFGKMSRKSKLSTILEALKGFGLQYKTTDERKITVMPL